VPKQDLPRIADPGAAPPADRGTRAVTFDGRSWRDAPVYWRDDLTGARLTGPAIVEQFDATTVLPPGWSAHLDGFGNIVAEREA
jgi:N-methylhydantoinase A